MNENEFQRLIHCRSGRAILYAIEHDVSAFRDMILDACLHCYAVDVQAEGTRADYMLNLVKLLPDKDFYCDRVIAALPSGGDDWNTVQRFRFAEIMASTGMSDLAEHSTTIRTRTQERRSNPYPAS